VSFNYPPGADPRSTPPIRSDDGPIEEIDAPIGASTTVILTVTTGTVVTIAGVFVGGVGLALIAGVLSVCVVALAAAML
jgi:hypothetical protein